EDAPPSRTDYDFQSFEFHLPLSIAPAVPAGALSFTVTLSTPDGATPATCADNPAAGIFSLSLPPASTGDYQWATTPGDTDADDRTLAIPCNDDNTSTTTLTFNPTLQEHWLHFSIRRDSVEEPSETILLTLTPGEGATTANLGGKDSLTYRIEIAPSDPP
ncbi:MAG: hypothetical protein GDA55_00405, partial [Cellvibrionales bacterium]|nr:hypothetical protein [Cellvibrionales bacterium]